MKTNRSYDFMFFWTICKVFKYCWRESSVNLWNQFFLKRKCTGHSDLKVIQNWGIMLSSRYMAFTFWPGLYAQIKHILFHPTQHILYMYIKNAGRCRALSWGGCTPTRSRGETRLGSSSWTHSSTWRRPTLLQASWTIMTGITSSPAYWTIMTGITSLPALWTIMTGITSSPASWTIMTGITSSPALWTIMIGITSSPA